jgi:hypothetical protein
MTKEEQSINEYLTQDRSEGKVFCDCWPCGKTALETLEDIPGLDPKVKDAIKILIAVGNKTSQAICRTDRAVDRTAEQLEWQGNINWAIKDTGVWERECIPQVAAVYPECLPTGAGRKCVMEKAIAAAHANNCNHAFDMALLCQCHNPHARSTIANAGQQAVCDYLKTK